MGEGETIIIGDFTDFEENGGFDLASTLRMRAGSIDRQKIWVSKDRSAEFMGDIWSLFVEPAKAERIRTVLHSVCVELIENTLKYGCRECDYMITVELRLKSDELRLYVVNRCDLSQIADLERAARSVLDAVNIKELFIEKMEAAKEAKKAGKDRSQLGFVRIAMQQVKLAWQIRTGPDGAYVTTLARILLSAEDR